MTFSNKVIDSQNCKFLTLKVIFLLQKLSESFWKKILKNINQGHQLLLKIVFDNLNLKKYFSKIRSLNSSKSIYAHTLSKKVQKFFQCNLCDYDKFLSNFVDLMKALHHHTMNCLPWIVQNNKRMTHDKIPLSALLG